MKIEDEFTVAAPIERTWEAIKDPRVVGPCLPGCEEIEELSPTTYRARVGVKVGPISARFVVEVEVIEETPPTRIVSVTRGEEGGKASNVRADNVVTLTPTADGATAVRYESEVTVTGRLAKFGFGVMKKKAQSLGAEFAKALSERLATETAA
jgi:carbon monoxide dehydrogenase subunit G